MEVNILHLSNCNTCQRIIEQVKRTGNTPTLQDIKKEPISKAQLEQLYLATGSYEKLFNRRSRQYRQRNLHQQMLDEDAYKELLLEEYTFLKRPVIQIDGEYFIGNSKKTVAAALEKLSTN